MHTKFVEDNYYGVPLHLGRIKDHIGLIKRRHLEEIEWAEAPVLVSTNRERYTMIHARSLHLAMLRRTVVIRWVTDFRKWQDQPSPDFVDKAMEDPCFHEYFVSGCPGVITKNMNKTLHLVNGRKVRYHSIVVPEDWTDWLKREIERTPIGHIVDLPVTPIAINVELDLHSSMSDSLKGALRELDISSTQNDNSVVIPITPMRADWPNDSPSGRPQRMTPVHGGDGFEPSRVQLRAVFPLQSALAYTIHKAQGETMNRAIIAMSQSPIHKWNFTYEQVHVAFSRVKQSSHLKLLLLGDTEDKKWGSITCVNRLAQDPCIGWYFMGFRRRLRPGEGDPNQNWVANEWSALRANQNYRLHLRGLDPYSHHNDTDVL